MDDRAAMDEHGDVDRPIPEVAPNDERSLSTDIRPLK